MFSASLYFFFFFFNFPIVYFLHDIYLSMCVHREITSYFSLAFTKLNKMDLSESSVTDRYKRTRSPSTHPYREADESLILRASHYVKTHNILCSASRVA